MKIILLTALVLVGVGVYAQNKYGKKLLDNETNREGFSQEITNYGISDDGKYVFYCLNSGELQVKSVKNSFKKTIPRVNGPSCFFTSDGKRIGYKSDFGNFFILTDFIKNSGDTITDVTSHQILIKDRVEWLLYHSKGALLIKNLSTGENQTISHSVDQYWINGPKSGIVYTGSDGLFWWNVGSKESRKIGSEKEIEDTNFDISGKKFLYCFSPENQKDNRVIGCYNAYNNTSLYISNRAEGIGSGFNIAAGPIKFNSDGNYIVFTLGKKDSIDKYTQKAKKLMTLWSYDKERYLENESIQLPISYAIKDLRDYNSKIVQLKSGFDQIIGHPGKTKLLLKSYPSSRNEDYQELMGKPVVKVISLSDGHIEDVVPENHKIGGLPQISRQERFLFWYNVFDDCIYTYEFDTHSLRNTTALIDVPKDMRKMNESSPVYRFNNFTGLYSKDQWLEKDHSFLIRDRFDIWQVDPLGKIAPINLTGGYGRKHRIAFDFLPFSLADRNFGSSKIVLRVLDLNTMNNGFCTVELGKATSLRMGVLNPCFFSWSAGETPPAIKKAKTSFNWLMMRQSANSSPNLVLTSDFKHYKEISNIHPEQDYNWLTSELVKYPMKNGKEGKGILFKPEDFDPHKKYPIIFHYYQERSKELNLFLKPGLSAGGINIPWFVSNGYLIFIPDIINDEPGQITSTALSSVNSAVDFLSQYAFIDTTKMGLQGHSFGGYETNILVANSNRFAAAQSSAGISDVIRGATDLAFGSPGFWMYEWGQFNLGSTPWENIDAYLKNSPVFRADKVITPLLLMHNRKDTVVPFGQSEGFFYSLRRLKKPVWLLQYNEEGHILTDRDDMLDFTIRQQQFFDHYLKGKPMPQWMVDGSLSLEVN